MKALYHFHTRMKYYWGCARYKCTATVVSEKTIVDRLSDPIHVQTKGVGLENNLFGNLGEQVNYVQYVCIY